jgi:hypothetical protein
MKPITVKMAVFWDVSLCGVINVPQDESSSHRLSWEPDISPISVFFNLMQHDFGIP